MGTGEPRTPVPRARVYEQLLVLFAVASLLLAFEVLFFFKVVVPQVMFKGGGTSLLACPRGPCRGSLGTFARRSDRASAADGNGPGGRLDCAFPEHSRLRRGQSPVGCVPETDRALEASLAATLTVLHGRVPKKSESAPTHRVCMNANRSTYCSPIIRRWSTAA